MTGIAPITEIIADIRAGHMVLLVDEEDRENEGDLVLAAQFTTPEHINFMARFGRGLICLTLTEARCRQLNLPQMVQRNGTRLGTNFTASIEAAQGVTTGISAADRAHTIKTAVARNARPEDLVSPGHVFPLMAQNGGVLVRAGHTEAGCDLAALAGLEPAAVICEILKDDGSMARLPDLIEFAAVHQLKIGAISDLIRYRAENERLVERVAERMVHTPYGAFRLIAFHEKAAQEMHLALVRGQPQAAQETLVRVHEPLSVFDLIDHDTSSHSWSVYEAMEAMQRVETGVIVLLRAPESGEQLVERIRRADEPVRVRQDLRDYGIGSQILRDLGVGKMRLMAVPRKMPSMVGFGLEVTGYLEKIHEKCDNSVMQSLNLTGHFLIAMPAMADPYFAGSLTYICEHNENGALGIVINRPLKMQLNDLLQQINVEVASQQPISGNRVYFGGPVQTDRGFVLHRPIGQWQSTIAVSGETALTTSRDILEATARGEGPEKILVSLGYAGWTAGQLEQEVAQNAWLTVEAIDNIIFDTPIEQRVEAAMGLLGVDFASLSETAGHA